MGWCSATNIFDPIVGTVLELKISNENKRVIIGELIDVLEAEDWDCQDDSLFIDNPLVRHEMKQRHPMWYEGTEEQ